MTEITPLTCGAALKSAVLLCAPLFIIGCGANVDGSDSPDGGPPATSNPDSSVPPGIDGGVVGSPEAGPTATCGNGACERAETCATCAADCGVCTPGMAGDLGHAEGDTALSFDDMTAAANLEEPLDCMMGHAAAVGDFDTDGFPDLLFGPFTDRPPETYGCPGGARPDRLLRNRGDGTFEYEPMPALEQHGRSSGAVFADLDNDGDLDLVVTRNARNRGTDRQTATTALYENRGGAFAEVSNAGGLAVPAMKARNVIPLDYDGDGRLDLFVVEDLLGDIGSKLFHNDGGLRFSDRTGAAGLPTDLGGLGAAAGDVNSDGWPDLFVAHEDQLFVNDGGGGFTHAGGLDAVFAWPGPEGGEDWRSGAAFGDVNRDGRPDLVVSHHYDSAYNSPRSVRLYLNRTDGGNVRFEDATGDAALDGIPSKAPHVEMQDMDNDGWLDLVVSVHARQDGASTPLVFMNQGGDSPRFSTPPFTVPTDESNIGYWAAAPTLDYDRDGRLDMFGAEWFASRDSVLYRNTSRSGNYLEVAVRPPEGTNAMGIGSRVDVFEAGGMGDASRRVGSLGIWTGYGYSSGQEAVAHFGLAGRSRVDVRVTLPHGRGTIEARDLEANQRWVAQ